MMNRLFLIGLFCASSAVSAEVQWIDRIVAIAGDDVVSQLELQREAVTVQRELQARKTPLPANDVFIKQILERLIVKKIQLQKATATGIRVDDVELNQAIEKIAGENRMNISQFRQAMQSQGMDYSLLRDDIREELVISKLRQREVDRGLKVTEQEIDSFLATQNLAGENRRAYQIAHILIAIPEAATPEQLQEAKAEAEMIFKRVSDGEDFSQLAVAQSDGQKALEGGDLGWREDDQLPTIFSAAVRKLKPGEVTEPIRSPSGFHLVKLVNSKDGTNATISETRARHILLSGDDARERLIAITEEIEAGTDFAVLAKKHSLDKGSAVNGGELGWAGPGKYVPAFENALNRLQPGQISEPFKSTFGWHIVQLQERRDAPVSRELLTAKAREFLLKQKQEEAELLWLRRLRDEAYVEYKIPQLKSDS